MAEVVIRKASSLGFCSGVKRAITILELTAAKDGPVQTLGPAVHNRPVVDKLAGLGVTVAPDLDKASGQRVAVPSHGAAPHVFAALEREGQQVVDTTCPIVHKAQIAARKLGESGFFVVVFGDAAHPEVEGLLGWAGKDSLATREAVALAKLDRLPRKIGIMAQTTMNSEAFRSFVKSILDLAADKVTEIHVINTICEVTHRQQQAAAKLASGVDLMLVVGGKTSSNTRRLAEVCQTAGTETRLIETAAEIEPGWLEGKKRIGITAGTSTPGWSIDEVAARIKELSANGK